MATAFPARVSQVPHAVESFFQWSLFALVACGFAAIAGSGQLDLPTLAFCTLALVTRAVMMFRGTCWAIPESYSTFLALLYVVVFFTDLLLISRSYVAATVHLVLFATVIKLFSVKRERDYLYLAMLAFLEILAASVLTVDSTFLITFALFVLFAVTTFLGMELRRSYIRAQSYTRPAVRSLEIPKQSLTRVASLLVLGIVLFASALFFVLPRKYGGYMSSLARTNELVTGFSDSVDLGAIGEIQQSDQVVMHVKVLSESVPMEGIRWRGVTLSNFDGRRWYNLPDFAPNPQFSDSGYFNLALPSRAWEPAAVRFATAESARTFRFRVSMEPIGTDVIFLPAAPKSLNGEFRVIERDFGQSVFDRDRLRGVTSYVGTSDVSRVSRPEITRSGNIYPAEVRERYAQLPPIDVRIGALARQITQSASSNYERAIEIEQYLHREYGYTLQLPTAEVDDPLIDFLFVRKEGHCEYFASAMAIMLRTMGIPSRIVNGFRGSEYNDLSGSYIVRARNAHSWVEAYFPGYGWAEFDPTPPAGDVYASSSSRIFLYIDAAREFWREWVVNYDFFRQQQLQSFAAKQGRHWAGDAVAWFRASYRSLVRHVRGWSDWLSSSGETAATAMFAGAGFMLVLVAVPFSWRLLRRRSIVANAGAHPSEAAALWYSRMLKNVERRGWRKLPSQTPGEFARSIGEPGLQQRVIWFTDCYERARFGRSSDAALQLGNRFKELDAVEAAPSFLPNS